MPTTEIKRHYAPTIQRLDSIYHVWMTMQNNVRQRLNSELREAGLKNGSAAVQPTLSRFQATFTTCDRDWQRLIKDAKKIEIEMLHDIRNDIVTDHSRFHHQVDSFIEKYTQFIHEFCVKWPLLTRQISFEDYQSIFLGKEDPASQGKGKVVEDEAPAPPKKMAYTSFCDREMLEDFLYPPSIVDDIDISFIPSEYLATEADLNASSPDDSSVDSCADTDQSDYLIHHNPSNTDMAKNDMTADIKIIQSENAPLWQRHDESRKLFLASCNQEVLHSFEKSSFPDPKNYVIPERYHNRAPSLPYAYYRKIAEDNASPTLVFSDTQLPVASGEKCMNYFTQSTGCKAIKMAYFGGTNIFVQERSDSVTSTTILLGRMDPSKPQRSVYHGVQDPTYKIVTLRGWHYGFNCKLHLANFIGINHVGKLDCPDRMSILGKKIKYPNGIKDTIVQIELFEADLRLVNTHFEKISTGDVVNYSSKRSVRVMTKNGTRIDFQSFDILAAAFNIPESELLTGNIRWLLGKEMYGTDESTIVHIEKIAQSEAEYITIKKP